MAKKKMARGVFYIGYQGQKELGQEIVRIGQEVSSKLKLISITDLSDEEFKLPLDYIEPKFPKPKHSANFHISPEQVKFLIDIFATWVGTKVLEEIWDRFKDSLNLSLFKKGASCELHFKSTLDEVTLILRLQANDDKQLEKLKKIVPKVIDQAKRWAKEKGITHNYMIYNLKNGDYSRVPILKNEL